MSEGQLPQHITSLIESNNSFDLFCIADDIEESFFMESEEELNDA